MQVSKDWTIYVTGYNGMVGRSLVRVLEENGYKNILFKSRDELDLRKQNKVKLFFEEYKPEIVIHLAAKVGGIIANINNPATFIYDNLMMQSNIIHYAYKNGCKKLIFLGSSCIYPREAPQPMNEGLLLSGKLEPTNQSYAVAKIAGIQLCQSYSKQYGCNFISPLPCNLYGPGDHFETENSHVMAALIRRIHKAKDENHEFVTVWGSGIPRREFLYVDDLANALVFLLENYDDSEIINVGSGKDIGIKELAEKIKKIIGFSGSIKFDTSKPDGMMQKLLDISKIEKLGWKAKTTLDQGIENSYKYYLKKYCD